MKHYGDITRLNGAELPPVDIITGGSPCQDLSVAGKRAGLAGERSGLFMEQIRLIKEMRDESRKRLQSSGAVVDRGCIRPRYMVWENVPGAFSSNGGKDFHAVLEETAKVAERDASIPGFEGGAGHQPDASWEMGGALLGEYTMRSFGEYPSEEKESRLSQILEAAPHPKYCLSEKACLGILRRAEKRGKKLPEMLEQALRKQAGLSVSKSEPENQGGGKGILIQNERTGALSTLNNQSVCCLNDQGGSVMGVSENVTGSLRAQEHGHQPIVYGISAYESNAMKSGNPNSGIYQAETARTLDLNGGSPACNQGGMAVVCIEGNGSRESHKGDGYRESETMYTLNTIEQHAVCVENRPQDSRLKIKEDGIVQTLDARMGEGGGNVPLVMEQQTFSDTAAARCAQDGRGGVHTQMMADPESNFILEPYTSSKASYHQHFTNDGKAETLVASDYKDPPTVTYGLDRAAYNQGMNAQFDFAVDAEKIGTQVAKGPGAVCNNYVVRRLTPMECERLQGYDDHWTDIGDWVDSKGKTHKGDSDSPRYKALGNSIALPFWQWMAERMCRYLPEFPTMASLFDGIGGFPLSFSRAGCKPVWASEIEEFPIAVTKVRFPDV